MDIIARSPFQSEITLKNGQVHVIGSLQLIGHVTTLKNKFGHDPKKWMPLNEIKTGEDLLLNEFILKCRGEFKLAYEDDELCHCRMVLADKVYNAVKQGARSVEDVARFTLAGTGCGSCRSDSQKILDQFKMTN
ncbi:MAG: (2Fe-2S)-binding protein [Bdellovibrio sp.]|nr:(2Fe-2S)-binding protein [Bdellovibrio sp.]